MAAPMPLEERTRVTGGPPAGAFPPPRPSGRRRLAILAGFLVAVLVLVPQPATAVTVTVASVTVEQTDNARLFDQTPAPVDSQAVNAAVEASRRHLERYLTAVFAAPDTRFSAAPLHDLLTPGAAGTLNTADERALGAISLAAERATPAPVEVSATVLADAAGVEATVLTYDAVVDVRLEDGRRGQVAQHAEMAFVAAGSGLLVDAVDASLQVPQALLEQP